jgi:hypothetical protein
VNAAASGSRPLVRAMARAFYRLAFCLTTLSLWTIAIILTLFAQVEILRDDFEKQAQNL